MSLSKHPVEEHVSVLLLVQSITLEQRKWEDVTAQKQFNTDMLCLRAANTLPKLRRKKLTHLVLTRQVSVISNKDSHCAVAGRKLEMRVG